MTLEEAEQIIRNDTASFSSWVIAVGILTSSTDSSLEDLVA